jgi:hypothetical protein
VRERPGDAGDDVVLSCGHRDLRAHDDGAPFHRCGRCADEAHIGASLPDRWESDRDLDSDPFRDANDREIARREALRATRRGRTQDEGVSKG